MALDRTEWGLLAAAVVMGVLGLVIPDWAVFLLTLSLAKALVVMGLLILWRTGLVSFGHALYFGTGAYAVGLLGIWFQWSDVVLLTVLASLAGALLAYVVGFLMARYRDIFFAMLSMALSMILYGILVKTEELGSTDGFNVLLPTFLGYAPEGEAMRIGTYLWTLLVSLVAGFSVHRYLASTIGQLTAAIRDNEIRVEYLGVSVRNVIHTEYVISGALAGAGGAITAFAVGHIDPDAMAYWTVSGEFVFVTILSGTGNVLAPFIGSTLFQVIRTFAFEYVPYAWQLVLGGSLLLIILFLPNGLWSLYARLRRAG